MRRSLLTLTTFLALAGRAHADFLADRATLDALLGAGATLERFEAYDINPGDAECLTVGDSQAEFVTLLDATTVAGEQGPGRARGRLPHAGLGRALMERRRLLRAADREPLGVRDHAGHRLRRPAVAFGVDLEIFRGFPTTVDVAVFAAAATILGSRAGILLTGPAPVFLGFADICSIGRVTLTSADRAFSLVIDNLAFGTTAVPEPSSLALCGISALAGPARRRASRSPA